MGRSIVLCLALASLVVAQMDVTTDPRSVTLQNGQTTLTLNTADLSSQAQTIQDELVTLPCLPTSYVGTSSWAPTITAFLGEYLPTAICGQSITLDETNRCLTAHGCFTPSVYLEGGATSLSYNLSNPTPYTYTASNRSTTITSSTGALTFGTVAPASSTSSENVGPSTASTTQSGNMAAKTGLVGSVAGLLGLAAGVLAL